MSLWLQRVIFRVLELGSFHLQYSQMMETKVVGDSSANFTLNKQWTGEAKGRLKEETACLHV